MIAFVRYVGKFVEDGMTGKPSMKRVALAVGVTALSAALIILSVAAFNGHSVGVETTAVATNLAAVIGYAYVRGKKVEGENAEAARDAAD